MGFFASSGILNRRGFFGGAAAFSPANISGLQLWLDATTGLFDATSGGSAVTTDGSAVARWEDQSGNARHATQSTLNNRPLLKTSVQNSKNVIRFDGSNDYFQGDNALKISFPMSIFAVVSQRGNTGSYNGVYGAGMLANAKGFGVFISQSSDNSGAFASQYRDGGTASTNYYTATIPSTNAFFVGHAIIDSSTNRVYFNNGSEDSISHSVPSVIPNTLVGIGARFTNETDTSHGLYLNGDIAEIIFYDSALSASNKNSVRDYLNTKWNVY